MSTAIAKSRQPDIWHLTGREQVRLAVALLTNGELSTSQVVETPLELLSSGLDDVQELAPQLAQLRDDTQGLVQHNLDVISGKVQGSGYTNHPDYAHIGRIMSNAELIERAISRPSTAAATPVDAATERLVETLTW